MSEVAALIERVEMIAEGDASAGRAPNAQAAIREAVSRYTPAVDRAYAELHPGLASRDYPSSHQREILAERYGLFYGAKMSELEEAADVVVRRWRGVQ